MRPKIVLIIGKSRIALRHYSILKKINKSFFFYFQDSKNRIWTFEKNQFIAETKDNIFKNIYLLLICSPSNTHIDFLNKYLSISKKIFIEKPFSNNFISILKFKRKILKLNNLPKIFIGYNLRYANSLIKFKKIIDQNNYGKLLYVTSQVGRSLDQWRDENLNLAASNKQRGGGVALELSHELDYLNWIFGPIKYISSKINQVKKFNLDVEESYFAIFKSKKNFLINLSVDMVRCDPKRFCEAIFEDATVNLDLIKGEVKIYKKKSLINYKFSSDIDNSYKNMWHNYILKNKTTSIRNLIKNSLLILRIIDVVKNNKF